MSIDFSSIIQSLHLTSFFKAIVLIGLGFYLIFLFVLYKQIRSMNQIVTQTMYGGLLLFIAFSLILLGLALFILSLAIL